MAPILQRCLALLSVHAAPMTKLSRDEPLLEAGDPNKDKADSYATGRVPNLLRRKELETISFSTHSVDVHDATRYRLLGITKEEEPHLVIAYSLKRHNRQGWSAYHPYRLSFQHARARSRYEELL